MSDLVAAFAVGTSTAYLGVFPFTSLTLSTHAERVFLLASELFFSPHSPPLFYYFTFFLQLSTMGTPPPTKSSISGDLPIRSAKPHKQDEVSKSEYTMATPEPLVTSDKTPEQVVETAKKVMMDPQAQDMERELATAMGTHVGRRKRKPRRPKSKRGQGKPTGFEEYYAEGPITPKEYEEMRKLYDP